MPVIPEFMIDCENMNTDFPYNLAIHKRRTSVSLHRHNFVEFSYTIKGRGLEIINGKCHEMLPGTFTFLLPYQVHEIQVNEGEEVEFYNCSMTLESFFDTGETGKLLNMLLFNEDDLPAHVRLPEGQSHIMDSLLKEMLHEFRSRTPWDKLLFRANLIKALVLFDRNRRGIIAMPEGKSSMNSQIWKAVHYVHTHYHEDIGLKDLAERFHFSVSYLSAAFRQHIGINFKDFLHETRIRHASSLLASTGMPVVDIAVEVGYKSYITFLRAFYDKHGVNPSDYRELKKQEHIAG